MSFKLFLKTKDLKLYDTLFSLRLHYLQKEHQQSIVRRSKAGAKLLHFFQIITTLSKKICTVDTINYHPTTSASINRQIAITFRRPRQPFSYVRE